jgi:hypothetical protein
MCAETITASAHVRAGGPINSARMELAKTLRDSADRLRDNALTLSVAADSLALIDITVDSRGGDLRHCVERCVTAAADVMAAAEQVTAWANAGTGSVGGGEVGPTPAPGRAQPFRDLVPERRLSGVTDRTMAVISLIVGNVAADIHRTAASVAAASGAARLRDHLLRLPTGGIRTKYALTRALVNPRGLRSVPWSARVVRWLGTVAGVESLAVNVATIALKLRIRAACARHPELVQDRLARRLIRAVCDDRQVEALLVWRQITAERGNGRTLNLFAPIFMEIAALLALLDENPHNDTAGWALLTGQAPPTDPIVGLSLSWISGFDHGGGRAVLLDPAGESAPFEPPGTIVAAMRNIAIMGNEGKILVQGVVDADGTERFVVQLPGMKVGPCDTDTPQDLLGAICNATLPDSPYTRGVRKALEQAGAPEGAEVAIIGHSAGGLAAMNLAASTDFVRRYELTHAIVVGSPVDNKRTASERTWVASVTHDHDIISTLDGRGPASPYQPHPDWFEVQYSDPRSEFPACHQPSAYVAGLNGVIADARDEIDRQLRRYRAEGAAETRTWLFGLRDT